MQAEDVVFMAVTGAREADWKQVRPLELNLEELAHCPYAHMPLTEASVWLRSKVKDVQIVFL